MLHNVACPYCSVAMEKSLNKDNSRSVEHLIPNTALRAKRTNADGDFYACRKCNAKKSHMDYLLGIITKSQSSDEEFSTSALLRSLDSENGSSKRFIEMFRSAKLDSELIVMDMPIFGPELLEYMTFLAKGQYFKKFNEILDLEKHVLHVDFINKQATKVVEEKYQKNHGSNPFRDLEQNPNAEVISEGDCIILSQNGTFLFFFHDYILICIKIMERNTENCRIAEEKNRYILSNFTCQT
jgi:hypothetical protein